MHLAEDAHPHTAECWWDCDEARWVCAPVGEVAKVAADNGSEAATRFGGHIAEVGDPAL